MAHVALADYISVLKAGRDCVGFLVSKLKDCSVLPKMTDLCMWSHMAAPSRLGTHFIHTHVQSLSFCTLISGFPYGQLFDQWYFACCAENAMDRNPWDSLSPDELKAYAVNRSQRFGFWLWMQAVQRGLLTDQRSALTGVLRYHGCPNSVLGLLALWGIVDGDYHSRERIVSAREELR
jgi:hypothetical protein